DRVGERHRSDSVVRYTAGGSNRRSDARASLECFRTRAIYKNRLRRISVDEDLRWMAEKKQVLRPLRGHQDDILRSPRSHFYCRFAVNVPVAAPPMSTVPFIAALLSTVPA